MSIFDRFPEIFWKEKKKKNQGQGLFQLNKWLYYPGNSAITDSIREAK